MILSQSQFTWKILPANISPKILKVSLWNNHPNTEPIEKTGTNKKTKVIVLKVTGNSKQEKAD